MIKSRLRLASYQPGQADFDLLYFTAALEPELPGMSQRRQVWQTHCNKHLYTSVATTHNSMLEAAPSKAIAAVIEAYTKP
jgi:hypothetical protein